MKAISLHQPWATWVALGWKTIETRTHARFKGLAGQRIAIHAAQKIDEAAFFEMTKYKHLSWLDVQNMTGFVAMTRGKIICTVEVAFAEWAHQLPVGTVADPTDFDGLEKQAMCDCHGKFLMGLKDRIMLAEAMPFKGRQGIFNVPDELLAGVRQYELPEVKP